MAFRPVDHDAREAARREFGRSLVLEAGAGTGKTTLLVDRIEALVLSGHARLEEIAAVTFTENAATVLKLRVRERLERARADPRRPEAERRRAASALEVVERAQVSTIHALCAAILQERPLECGVIPGFRTADETEADLLFGEAWEEWLAEGLLTGDEALVDALEAGIPLEAETSWGERSSLRGLARALVEQRDLAPLVEEARADPRAWREELLAKAARGVALAEGVPDADSLAGRLRGLQEHAEASLGLSGRALRDHLFRIAPITKSFGLKARWPSEEVLSEARGIAAWTSEGPVAWRLLEGAALHGRLVGALRGVAERFARKKAARGVLDFLDLLLKVRDALRDHESVRRHIQRRFRFLIIDEFQDTDPLQVEIARLLGGAEPGGLVVVGDPKQSIYRFRRADVALFRKLAEEAEAGGRSDLRRLTQNFRSRPAILRFVNRVFAELIKPSAETDQAAYEPISAPPGLPEDASVIGLRFEAPFAEKADLLSAEAQALATLVAAAGRGRFEVRDPVSGESRPSRAGDVMVLTRRLTQLSHLEDALERAGVRFAVEGGKSFFDRQEIHEVLAVLRAVEDPSDQVALVAALRSSFLGVSDRDIVGYALATRGLPRPGAVETDKPGGAALAPALSLIERLRELRTRVSVSVLIETLYDETRILAALTHTRRGEARIANLEKVVSIARQSVDLGVLTLRGFTRLLEERIASAREEPDLPSSRPGDPDTVRILTIHKAKGLEAPIVCLHDTADNFVSMVDAIPLWDEGKIAVGFREGCQPPRWAALRQRDGAKAWAEARRLLYVACTRARDLLVIPKPPPDANLGAFWKELIDRVPVAGDADVRIVEAESLLARDEDPTDLRSLAEAEGGDAVAALWQEERARRIEAASARPYRSLSVTEAVAQPLDEGEPEANVPGPALVPGKGVDFGRLVHHLLERTALLDPAQVDVGAMARVLAPQFGLGADQADSAAESARRALALPLLERARKAKRVWRELSFWLPEGEDLIEGIVDLAFEEDEGLVVVDYKTDRVTRDEAIDRAAHHGRQLRLYGRGLTLSLGLPVRERLVLFTAIGEAIAV
jgi:ATP-dependent helicase/nuclease subunit A